MASNYRLQIVKELGFEQWANDYILRHDDIDAAANAADLLVAFERSIHDSRIIFDYFIVSDPNPDTRIFRHVVLNEPGLVDGSSFQYLPLFNTVRVDLQTVDTDPGRKYYRTPIYESNQVDGVLTESSVSFYQGIVDDQIVANLAELKLVTRDTVFVTGAVVHPQIQMRQLHRRRKPKAPPA